METFVFDGSLEGLLTAIFEYYKRKSGQVKLVEESRALPDAFQKALTISSDPEKAKRVWTGLAKKAGKEWLVKFYKSYLSEQPEIFQKMLEFAIYIIDNKEGACENYANPAVLAVSQMSQKVHREKHRMEAFIRFQKTADGIFYAHIEPDFDVLPLLIKHFKNRYADQRWIIYDLRRKYAITYDLEKVDIVEIEFPAHMSSNLNTLPEQFLDEGEGQYSLLWQDYFKSANIEARKNIKLHTRHVPRRYWKYLSEKQGL